jgi:hypothetical protein
MDSKVVSREIKKSIWPPLRDAGFDTFTSRIAWRHNEGSIDVVEFQSLGNYNAEVMGLTSFSFDVRLGKFPTYLPPQWPLKVKDGAQLPSEAESPFRRSLQCSLASKSIDKSLWSVAKDGRNLVWCIRDVAAQLPNTLAWFARLDDRREVLRILQSQDEQMSNLWGFGRNPSPLRSYLLGYAALALGEDKLAKLKLQEAVESKCFVNLFASLDGAIRRAV